MDYLVAYDVETTTPAGQRRLRRVAKICEGFGVRTQYSVFECVLNEISRPTLIAKLQDAIDPRTDRIAIYPLLGDAREKAFRLGRIGFDIRDPLIL